MTDKTDKKSEKEAKRIQPDKPLGETVQREDEDFYAKQRRESPDGMTAAEREQHQKAAPGSLNQTAADGKPVGESEDEANPVGGKQQSAGR